MARERTKNLTYDELFRFRIVETGMSPVGAALVDMELQIRHLEALDKATKENEKLSRRVYALNWFMGLLTIISTALTFSLWVNPDWQGLIKIFWFSD